MYKVFHDDAAQSSRSGSSVRLLFIRGVSSVPPLILGQGRVPRVELATPEAMGVTTGTAAPISSYMALFDCVEYQTLPEPSIAMPSGATGIAVADGLAI